MYMISSNLLLLFNINYIKSWIYSNLMEIGFYSNKRKIEKKIAICLIWTRDLKVITSTMPQQSRLLGLSMLVVSIWCTVVTFNVLKVSQSRAIIDRFCQDEGFELTYYIETLVTTMIIKMIYSRFTQRKLCEKIIMLRAIGYLSSFELWFYIPQ